MQVGNMQVGNMQEAGGTATADSRISVRILICVGPLKKRLAIKRCCCRRCGCTFRVCKDINVVVGSAQIRDLGW